MEAEKESPVRALEKDILTAVLKFLQEYRLAMSENKGKKPEEVAAEQDAANWINSAIIHFERNVAAFEKEKDYPLLQALHHILATCCSGEDIKPHTIEKCDAARTASQEYRGTHYGDPEINYLSAELLIEDLLTIGERHGAIIDKRRPAVYADGRAEMGRKYNKIDIENQQADIVKERERAKIAALGIPLWVAKKTDPGLYHENKGPNGEWDFSHCI